jgi:hypothetical protein
VTAASYDAVLALSLCNSASSDALCGGRDAGHSCVRKSPKRMGPACCHSRREQPRGCALRRVVVGLVIVVVIIGAHGINARKTVAQSRAFCSAGMASTVVYQCDKQSRVCRSDCRSDAGTCEGGAWMAKA